MTVESRATWGARPTRGTSYLASTRGVKGHYTGGAVNAGTLTDHAKCHAAIRAIQNQHMDGNGWNDIGYSMWACEHAAGIGRGPHVLPAANGAGLNSGHYAILVLVGTSGSTKITDNMKRHFHEARDYLISKGAAGKEIKGHRDGYATSCPGPSVYPWIQAGAPKPGGQAPTPPHTPEDDDMPQFFYAAYSIDPDKSPAQELTMPSVNTWRDIPWFGSDGPENEHAAGSATVMKGDPCIHDSEVAVTFEGLKDGDRVQLRYVEYEYVPASGSTPAVDNPVEYGDPILSVLGPDLRAHMRTQGTLQEGRKLRFQARFLNAATGPVRIVRGRLRIDYRK